MHVHAMVYRAGHIRLQDLSLAFQLLTPHQLFILYLPTSAHQPVSTGGFISVSSPNLPPSHLSYNVLANIIHR